MDIAENPVHLELTGPEISVEIKKYPSIKTLFLKMALLSLKRPSTLADDINLSRARMVLNNLTLDTEKIQKYKRVCGFTNPGNTIPISYFQTLFIGLLGKFVTTPYFPINPMGLIHIGQSFEQKRPITTDETLVLSCSLHGVTKTQKGITSQFLLEVISDKKTIWKGISSFFTRSKIKRSKKKISKEKETFLTILETIFVPRDMGRQYAGVSNDYNPHHLHWLTARIFGFKQPIAHGMWSLARVIASLESDCESQYPRGVNAEFKLPIFMPATITLGYEKQKPETSKTQTSKTQDSKPPTDKNKTHENQINFELRDESKGVPHLKGQFYF